MILQTIYVCKLILRGRKADKQHTQKTKIEAHSQYHWFSKLGMHKNCLRGLFKTENPYIPFR